MAAATQLLAFGLRQVIDVSPDVVENVAGMAADVVASAGTAGKVFVLVRQRLADHGETLPKALAAANDRAWQALAVALAGRGFLTRVKEFLTGGNTPRAIQDQVEGFLARNATDFAGTSDEFRRDCLRELHKARKGGLLLACVILATYHGRATPVISLKAQSCPPTFRPVDRTRMTACASKSAPARSKATPWWLSSLGVGSDRSGRPGDQGASLAP